MVFKHNSFCSMENEAKKFYEMFIGLARVEYYMSTIAIVKNLLTEIIIGAINQRRIYPISFGNYCFRTKIRYI